MFLVLGRMQFLVPHLVSGKPSTAVEWKLVAV